MRLPAIYPYVILGPVGLILVRVVDSLRCTLFRER